MYSVSKSAGILIKLYCMHVVKLVHHFNRAYRKIVRLDNESAHVNVMFKTITSFPVGVVVTLVIEWFIV